MFPQGAIDRLLKDMPVDPPGPRGEERIVRTPFFWDQEGPHIVPEPPAYCGVEVYGIDGRTWTYIGFEDTKVGDVVVVPFGAADFDVYGEVKEMGRRYRGPMPIKKIDRKVELDEEELKHARAGGRPTA